MSNHKLSPAWRNGTVSTHDHDHSRALFTTQEHSWPLKSTHREYIQQGNMRVITDIVRGFLFHLLFKNILSTKSNQLQYLCSCQYTHSFPDFVVRPVCVVCSHVLSTEWQYSCILSESSNYKLGYLDMKICHTLRHSPTSLLEPPAWQAMPGLKT